MRKKRPLYSSLVSLSPRHCKVKLDRKKLTLKVILTSGTIKFQHSIVWLISSGLRIPLLFILIRSRSFPRSFISFFILFSLKFNYVSVHFIVMPRIILSSSKRSYPQREPLCIVFLITYSFANWTLKVFKKVFIYNGTIKCYKYPGFKIKFRLDNGIN